MKPESQKFLDTCGFFIVIRQRSTGDIFHLVGFREEPTDASISSLWDELKDDKDFPNTAEIVRNKDFEYQVLNRTEHSEIIDWLITEQ
ncbi:MAG: hypothetical protein LBF37_02040 [Rickettsiales bacterium]|jgi:hypothetical protein|nr:hypothetical protein [Rickettsiales bacterium]